MPRTVLAPIRRISFLPVPTAYILTHSHFTVLLHSIEKTYHLPLRHLTRFHINTLARDDILSAMEAPQAAAKNFGPNVTITLWAPDRYSWIRTLSHGSIINWAEALHPTCAVKPIDSLTQDSMRPRFVLTGPAQSAHIVAARIAQRMSRIYDHMPIAMDRITPGYGEVVRHLIVPPKQAGVVIGKYGTVIKQIADDARCRHINWPRLGENCIFHMVGTEDGVKKACQLIVDLLFQATGKPIDKLLAEQWGEWRRAKTDMEKYSLCYLVCGDTTACDEGGTRFTRDLSQSPTPAV